MPKAPTCGRGHPSDTQAATVQLRIMATTDLHMQILPWDYFGDRPAPQRGLSTLAAMIARHRATCPNTLLLDNGDFLHGNPLGDFVAGRRGDAQLDGVHPVIAAMNALRYDAATLGNHDFNSGTAFLLRALAGAHHPVTISNVRVLGDRGLIAPHLLLDRDVVDDAGVARRLRIGIVGFLPPQTLDWNVALASRVRCDDMLPAAARAVPALRAAGADLVIALAHSGIGDCAPDQRTENAATALARTPGIDAVVAGHTHLVFPGPGAPRDPDVDPVRGTLAGKPAVMAGFWGSHLGVIDLSLRQDADDGTWTIADFASRAEPATADRPVVAGLPHDAAPADPGPAATALVASQVMAVHRRTLRRQRRRIGVTRQALHSYFALLGEDRGLRLVAAAQRWHARRMLGRAADNLPILSAVAPFRAGGRAGPRYYTDVPAGALNLRALADLYLYPNRMRVVTITGAQLSEWLERAASIFQRVMPGRHDQPLLDPDFATYNFDIIDGLTWQVDPTAAARFCPDGQPTGAVPADGGRITDLRRHGRPVAPGDRFLLATNSYRLSSCRMFSALGSRLKVVMHEDLPTREVLHRYVARRRRIDLPPGRPWRFAHCPDTSVIVETGPGALDHLDCLSDLRVEQAGMTPGGFVRLRLHL